MNYVVRAVDVGFGNTKYISSVAAGDIRCASFPSVAYPTMREPSGQPGYERRKTVAIPINGLFYEVGPDVELAADTFRATQMHDRYTETSEYMALLRGALALMKLPSIDLLVVGLPVAALARRLAARDQASTEATVPGGLAAATAQAGVENSNLANVGNGKKCPECGAHALHKVDGCLRCANCHHIGSCG